MKKYNIRIASTFVFLAFFLLQLPVLNASSDEDEVIDPFMEFSYWKNNMDQKVLQVKMSYFTDISQLPLSGLPMQFYTNEENPFLIGSASTDSKGIVKFVVPDSCEIGLNTEGMMYFYAEFEGNDKINPALEEVWVKDVNLEMKLDESEDLRQILLRAFTVEEGDTIPVNGEDIYIYVPRMFSDLQVAEGYFEDGNALVEFPSGLPGDSLGNITIISRFNDHYLYANVEKREIADWGVPAYHEGPGDVRALWTQVAPKWMIITLSILLAGVWGHYLFTIITMIRIGKQGKTAKSAS